MRKKVWIFSLCLSVFLIIFSLVLYFTRLNNLMNGSQIIRSMFRKVTISVVALNILSIIISIINLKIEKRKEKREKRKRN